MLMRIIGPVVLIKSFFPNLTVRIHEKSRKIPMTQLYLGAGGIDDCTEFEIHIVQLSENLGWRPGNILAHGKNPFDFFREGMRFVSQDLFEIKPVFPHGIVR